ncbi:MAG TPA: flagellar motor protein MotB [Cellvibrionaceae bacterium]
MEKDAQSIIIIKKKKGHGHGHHGGGWKVAFADFMTAMMAFFLLMWVIESTTPAEKEAIAGYFKNPGNNFVIGPGGADSSVIDMNPTQHESDPVDEQKDEPIDPGRNVSEEVTKDSSGADKDSGTGQGKDQQKDTSDTPDSKLNKDVIAEAMAKQEKEQLEELKEKLETEVNKVDSAFVELKDQIMIDFTALGLRIQIVDKDKRPMFDLGSPKLLPYSVDALKGLAPILNKVPNKISITGHTDANPYGVGATYTNWELSADRANAARRALILGKYPEEKVSTVQGMGSSAPFNVADPSAAINRRIAIIALKKAVSDALNNGTSGISSEDLINAQQPKTLIQDDPPPATYQRLQ